MLARFKLQTLAVLGNPGGSTFGHFKLDADFLSVALEVGLDDAVTPPDRHVDPLYQKMTEKGFNVKRSDWNDSHMFPCTRVRAACTVLEYLAEME